ncbi:hypothetical protein HXX76_009557 [Chlamydomonas incerta]|uniref:MYND-type domain-containing protein n=1 Tax=Chlamydomonas incerta TaxID=51695 RepID=A0A835SQX2_CHLIN|nr:hypothetical protein HXX76_009557 [Chlamydomonas incerta]|eukprot:KAG2431543.1 hypothetical protein HXX76_009557 [Chlamydomonas incerta]
MTAVAVIGGASSAADRVRPLAELLVLELSRSGFLDQAARLALHGATADGAARRRQQRQRGLTGLTLVLAQVVATLAAAGFGGGERGVWGLPAELAAGLPLLSHSDSGVSSDLRDQPSGGGRLEPPFLSADPFTLLNQMSEMARSLPCAATEVPTAACAPPGRAPTSAGSCGASSARADRGDRERGADGADGAGWSFPVSPRAAALVLLRVADLAAASLDRTMAVALAPVGEAAAAPVGPAAPASLLRLRAIDAWNEGRVAIINAKQLLVWRRTRHRLQKQTVAAPVPVPRGSSAAAGSGRGDRAAGSAASSAASGAASSAASGAAYGDEYGDVYPRRPVAWWRSLARMLPHAVAPPPPATGSDGSTASMSPGEAAGRAIAWAKTVLAVDMEPPDVLLERAPPALAAALAGGVVAGVEAAVRAAPDSGVALEFAAAFLQVNTETAAKLGACWPLLQQLLAFAPPAQAAALIASLGKQGHLVVGGLAAAVGGGGSAAAKTARAVMSRGARLLRAERRAGPPVALVSPHSLVLQWCVPLLCILARREAASAAAAAGSANIASSSRAAAEFGGAGAAVAGAAAAAVAASWRQLLLHDIELVPLLESLLLLLLLAALPAGNPAATSAANLVASLVTLLPLAAPDALAPVLTPPLQPDSPWGPAVVAAVLQKHMVGGGVDHTPACEALHQLRTRAMVATQAELRAGYLGGPIARAANVPRVVDQLLGELSPLEVTTEAEAVAAEAEALAAGSSSAAMATASKWTLLCCATRCTNLAGRSEAELPLQACGSCKAVRYCGRACQAAHWRAGHKEACGALKGKGGAGAGAGG